VIGAALRDRLGDDASRELADYLERCGEEWRQQAVGVCTARVEGKMDHYADRNEVVDGFARIASQMADMKVELVRWSFAFWVGQVVVTLAIVALFARLIQP
jgi:hypothetical protein